MTHRIRILPVLIIAAGGLFFLKSFTIAEAASEMAPTPAEAATDATGPEADGEGETGIGTADLEAAPAPATASASGASSAALTCPPTVDFEAEAGISQYEIQVLRSLSERREALDARERELDTRENMILAAEDRLDEQIAELTSLEDGVRDLLGQLGEAEEARMAGLVKVYESMKPKDAARIFETLDDDILFSVVSRMKPAVLAEVMANMSSQRARDVTRMLAERAKLPETAGELMSRDAG